MMRFTRLPIVLILINIAAFAQRPQPIRELSVFDSTGQRVGFVVGSGPPAAFARLAFSAEKTLVTVFVNRVTFFADGDDVFFEGPNCTGSPWLRRLSTTALFPIVAVAQPGMTVYWADAQGQVAMITALSVLPQSNGSQPPGQCMNIPERVLNDALMAKSLGDFSRFFVPPFNVRLND